MVGGHDDQGLLGVFLVEFVGDLDAFIEIDDLMDAGGSIMAVVGVVDLAALRHQEEALLVVLHQEGHGALDELLEGDVVVLMLGDFAVRVDAIGDGLAFAGEHQDLLHILPPSLELLGIADRVAGGLELGTERGSGLRVFAVNGGTAIEIETVGQHVLADLIVHAAVRLMGLEGARRGVVDARRGHDADLLALGFRHLGHIAERVAVRIDAQAAVLGLYTGCEGRTRGGGIRHVIVGGIMGGHRGDGELREAKRLGAEFALDGSQVHLRQQHGVSAHAVTDEIEHVLGGLGQRAQRNQQDAEGKDDFLHIRKRILP